MATPDGVIVFEAGEKAYRLQLDINRMCLLEDHLGKSALDIATELQFNPKITTIRAIFWAALGNKDMTLAQAGDIIQAVGTAKAVGYARDALAAAFPTVDDEPSEESEASDEAPPSESGGWLGLLREWSAAGFPPDQFWTQTPRTYQFVMRGYFDREKRAHRSRAWLAKMTGWLAQADPKKVPSVQKLAGEQPPRPRPMNDNAIAASMDAWAAMTKGR